MLYRMLKGKISDQKCSGDVNVPFLYREEDFIRVQMLRRCELWHPIGPRGDVVRAVLFNVNPICVHALLVLPERHRTRYSFTKYATRLPCSENTSSAKVAALQSRK